MAALAGAAQEAAQAQEPLEEELTATEEHCRFCFEALVARLEGRAAPEPDFPGRGLKAPLFVTWKKRRADGQLYLRGCIGNFSDLPLRTGLHEYALTSALQDSRFEPIRTDEVPALSVGVSLLVDFEDAANAMDWQVGVHGIRISFVDPIDGRRRSGTFLPEVAAEQGWTQRETLEALVRKTGSRATLDEALLRAIKLVRYKSSKHEMTWDTFAAGGGDSGCGSGGAAPPVAV